MLYGNDLIYAGWNSTKVTAGDPGPAAPSRLYTIDDEISHSFKNVAAFDQALDDLSEWLTPRCCGC